MTMTGSLTGAWSRWMRGLVFALALGALPVAALAANAAAPGGSAATAQAVATPAAAPAPAATPTEAVSSDANAKINPGDTAWMLASTALVLMMTVPGLALYYGVMDTPRRLAILRHAPTLLEGLSNGRIAFVQTALQETHFRHLLGGKGEPAADLGVQPLLPHEIHGGMQKRATARYRKTALMALGRTQHPERGFEVGAPDVAAVDHAQGQKFVGRQRLQDRGQLIRATHEIDMQARRGELAGQLTVGPQALEIGRQQELRARRRKPFVGLGVGIRPGLG